MNAGVGKNSYESQLNTPLLRRAAWLMWSGVINIANSVLLWMVMARSTTVS